MLLALPLAAQDSVRTYTVGDVPNVHLADRRQYVSDPTGILSTGARATVNATLDSLESQTGIEVAVVMLPSIGQDDPFEFALRLFRQWGVGKKKKDNGLVVLFVGDQRQVRFVTGYGLEGSLPDITCKRIQTRYMVPAFRQGDYDLGMVAGMKAVYAQLRDSMRPDSTDGEGSSAWNYAFLVFAIALCTVLPVMMERRRKKCPRCGKRSLRKVSSSVFRYEHSTHRVRRDVYVCDNCGHIVNRDNDLGDGSGNAGSLTDALFLGSMLGRGRGGGFGGGFGGGHFGGGSSGGGGAGSGW